MELQLGELPSDDGDHGASRYDIDAKVRSGCIEVGERRGAVHAEQGGHPGNVSALDPARPRDDNALKGSVEIRTGEEFGDEVARGHRGSIECADIGQLAGARRPSCVFGEPHKMIERFVLTAIAVPDNDRQTEFLVNVVSNSQAPQRYFAPRKRRRESMRTTSGTVLYDGDACGRGTNG